LPTLRLMNRSMMMAKASMEHAINGQMGHPAACMMENKTETPCSEKQVDYGARFSNVFPTSLLSHEA
jgi:hypothetical protein